MQNVNVLGKTVEKAHLPFLGVMQLTIEVPVVSEESLGERKDRGLRGDHTLRVEEREFSLKLVQVPSTYLPWISRSSQVVPQIQLYFVTKAHKISLDLLSIVPGYEQPHVKSYVGST